MKVSRSRKRILVIIVVVICICAVIWYTIDDKNLAKVASIVTIISFIVAPIWYFVTKAQDEKDERRRASKNLYKELEDTLDGLDEEKHGDLKKVMINDEEFYFMNRGLNHDFYDSLISSGKITFLSPDLLQPLQDIYQRIKDHNFYIRKIRDIEDNAEPDEDINPKVYRYYKKLDVDEKKANRRNSS